MWSVPFHESYSDVERRELEFCFSRVPTAIFLKIFSRCYSRDVSETISSSFFFFFISSAVLATFSILTKSLRRQCTTARFWRGCYRFSTFSLGVCMNSCVHRYKGIGKTNMWSEHQFNGRFLKFITIFKFLNFSLSFPQQKMKKHP